MEKVASAGRRGEEGKRREGRGGKVKEYTSILFHIPAYVMIYSHIFPYTIIYFHILPYTHILSYDSIYFSICLQISDIRNMRANMRANKGDISRPKVFSQMRICHNTMGQTVSNALKVPIDHPKSVL